jgi:predicted alpha/beta superfamily hydrolase
MKNVTLTLVVSFLSICLYGQEYERYKKITDTLIISDHLGFKKNVTITVPFEWQRNTNQKFPLIIVFDKQNQRSHNYILNTIDYLTSNEQMPSAVIVSVASSQNYRHLETMHKESSENGLAEQNEKFLFEELIPLMESEYRASSFRLFIGHSRYGYFTTSLLFSGMDKLNAVISLSPFFSQKNVELVDSISNLNNHEFSATKYYRFGIGNDYPNQFYEMDSVLKTVSNKSIDAKGVLFKEADHNVTPGLTISVALYEIFENWSETQSIYFSNDQKDLKIIRSLEEDIVEYYGSPLAFSLGILNGKGWYFYGESEYEKAIEAWEIMLASYPTFSEAYLYIIDAKIKLKRDYSSVAELFKKSLANSEIYSKEEKSDLLKELDGLKE